MRNNPSVIAIFFMGVFLGILACYLYFKPQLIELKFKNSTLEKQVQENAEMLSLTNQQSPDNPKEKDNRLIFKDTFDDNVNRWDTQLRKHGMKIIYDGKFIIDYKEKGYFWWSWLPIKREATNYNVVLKSKQKSGRSDKYYGLILSMDSMNYHRFSLTNNGYASINLKKNGEWQNDLVNYIGGHKSTSEDGSDIFEVRVRGIRFTYLANGKKVYEGTLDTDKSWKNIGIFVEDIQTVEFDEISITETD
ncbi:MAG: hypothetical protein IPM47_18235 [Sphingobacteriales bacterium]|nr:MAG: hypothetical protein IPM47_18235 [Sphingobacteriales bacterium]